MKRKNKIERLMRIIILAIAFLVMAVGMVRSIDIEDLIAANTQLGAKSTPEILYYNSDESDKTGATIINLPILSGMGEANHDHVFETKYDEDYHWRECFICHQIEEGSMQPHNVKVDIPTSMGDIGQWYVDNIQPKYGGIESTWKYLNTDKLQDNRITDAEKQIYSSAYHEFDGYWNTHKNLCGEGNASVNFSCDCGYSHNFKKLHNRVLRTLPHRFRHTMSCADCIETLEWTDDSHKCRDTNGNILGCETGIYGTCATCGFTYNPGFHGCIETHNWIKNNDLQEGVCGVCGVKVFDYTETNEITSQGENKTTFHIYNLIPGLRIYWDPIPDRFWVNSNTWMTRMGYDYTDTAGSRYFVGYDINGQKGYEGGPSGGDSHHRATIMPNYENTAYYDENTNEYFISMTAKYAPNADPGRISFVFKCLYEYDNPYDNSSNKIGNVVFLNSKELSAPDNYAPQPNGNFTVEYQDYHKGYAKKATIKAKFTENYDSVVEAAVLDQANEFITNFETSTNNGNGTFSHEFDLTGIETDEMDVVVEARDRSDNISTKNVKIVKLDNKAPTLEVQTDYDDKWAKEKVIKFIFTDKGAGDVQVAFNRRSDYKPATKEGDTYTRTYDFKGSQIIGNYFPVFVKDGIGNETMYKIKIGKLGDENLGSFRLNSSYNIGDNFVHLWWDKPDVTPGWSYRLYEQNKEKEEYNSVSTNYNKNVKVLNVYPVEAGKVLKGWMQTYGQGLIQVDEVIIDQFNQNPEGILKNSDGTYKYDVIMFGSYDSNGGDEKDLSTLSRNAVEKFINSGRGVLFGHDTICLASNALHKNMNSLQSYANMEAGNYPWIGSTKIKVTKKGALTKYPYNIETRDLTIPLSHSTGELAYGDIWMRYLQPWQEDFSEGPEIGNNSNNNYYLTTWNNTAVIRTGHSVGGAGPYAVAQATEDEQMVIANTLFYLGQVTKNNECDAYTAYDASAPDKPRVIVSGNTVTISAKDNGTEYTHYVVAENDITGQVAKSNTVRNTVITGIKGYKITTTKDEPDEKDFNMIGDNAYHESYTFTVDRGSANDGKYYIWVIDGAGNVSRATEVNLGPVPISGIIKGITLNHSYTNGQEFVNLSWTEPYFNNPGDTPGWKYDVYQSIDGANWRKIASNLTSRSYQAETPIDNTENKEITYFHYIVGYYTGSKEIENHDKTQTSNIVKDQVGNEDSESGDPPTPPIPPVGPDDDYFCIEELLPNEDILSGHFLPTVDDATVLGYFAKEYESGKEVGGRTNTQKDNSVPSKSYEYSESEAFSSEVIKRTRTTPYKYVSPTIPVYTVADSDLNLQAPNDAAYILAMYKYGLVNKKEAQEALYGTSLARGTTNTDLTREAKKYEAYRARVKGNYEDTYSNVYKNNTVRTYYQLEEQYSLIGPFKVDYIRESTKQGSRPKADFSGIIKAVIYDEKGKTYDHKDKKWEFYYLDTAQRSSNQSKYADSDTDYPYPYPNEEFYIKIPLVENINQIEKIEFKLHEKIMTASYDKRTATFDLIQWENKIDLSSQWSTGGNPIYNNNIIIGHTPTHHYYTFKYTLQEVGLAATGIKAQDTINVHDAGNGTTIVDNKYTFILEDFKTENNNPDPTDIDPNDPDPTDPDVQEPDPEEDDPSDDDNIKIKVKFTGYVWDDGDEKDTNRNGLFGEGDKGIAKVRVTLTHYMTGVVERETFTDHNGYFEIEEIPPDLYNVEFEYDGQEYKTSYYLVGGEEEDYYKHPRTSRYFNNSKAEETEYERTELNERFYEIAKTGAIGRDQNLLNPVSLKYNVMTRKSEIVTRNPDKTVLNYPKDNQRLSYAIRSRTSTVDLTSTTNPISNVKPEHKLLYPISKNYPIGGVNYIKVRNMYHINLALTKRVKVDGSLKMDLYESQYVIKGVSQKFLHSEKYNNNIRYDRNSNVDNKLAVNNTVIKYEDILNRADYNWKFTPYADAYKDNFINLWLTDEEIATNSEEGRKNLGKYKTELKGYIDTVTIIRNDEPDSRLQVSELANYFDKDLIYQNEGYRDYEEGSWAVIKTNKVTEETSQKYEKIPIIWNADSKYGDINEYKDEYNKKYTNSLDEAKYAIANDEYIELHIIYEIAKDEEERLRVEEGKSVDVGKKTFIEINGYKGLTENILQKEDGTILHRKVDGNEDAIYEQISSNKNTEAPEYQYQHLIDSGKEVYKEETGEGTIYRFIEGIIDRDSRPGNMNPNDIEKYEDDEDKTPTYRTLLTTKYTDGDDYNPMNPIMPDEDGNIGNIAEIDENGEITWLDKKNHYDGNAISGSVWEDLRKDIVEQNDMVKQTVIGNDRTKVLFDIKKHEQEDAAKGRTLERTLTLPNNQVVSDGYMQDDEPLINDIKAELWENFESPITGKSKLLQVIKVDKDGNTQYEKDENGEYLLDEKGNKIPVIISMRSRRAISIKKEEIRQGEYGFYNLTAGKYKIKMIYGDEEQLLDESENGYYINDKGQVDTTEKDKRIKYNGQDFQSVLTKEKYAPFGPDGAEGVEPDYSNVEIMINMDVSGSMGFATENNVSSINSTRDIAQSLITNLKTKLNKVKLRLSLFNDMQKILPESERALEDNIPIEELQNRIRDLTNVEGQTYLAKGMKTPTSEYTNNALKKVMIILTDSYPVGESTEDSIRALEEIYDKQGIYPIAIITSDEKSVFGSNEKPRRGKVYEVGNMTLEEIIKQIEDTIIDEVVDDALPEDDAGVIGDVQGKGAMKDDEGTRRGNVTMYNLNLMSYTYGNKLHVSRIENIEDPEERKEAIKEFAKMTYMQAWGSEVTLKSNTTSTVPGSNIIINNLGLEERPTAELKLDEEIENIQVILADGNMIIDTAKGVNKNVNGLDLVNNYLQTKEKYEEEQQNRATQARVNSTNEREAPSIKMGTYIRPSVSIYMDEEIMQGATIKVTYKIKITNKGEIDRLANYYEYTPETPGYEKALETIPTKASKVFSYKYPNWTFREEDQIDKIWTLLDSIDKNVGFSVSDETKNATYEMETRNPVVLSSGIGFSEALYPEESTEVKRGEKVASVTKRLVLSKLISPNDDKDTLTYGNSTEIVQRENAVGRRSYTSVPANYAPGDMKKEPLELDEIELASIIITKPLGGYVRNNIPVIIASLALIGCGIVALRVHWGRFQMHKRC